MKAVIMAGGKGTRLMPLTRDIPKPLVKILDKPCMQYTIELLKKHGITEIAVTLGYKAQMIMDYFGDGSDLGVHLQYFVEDTPLGTAGSVKSTSNFVSEDFLVISGDAYTDLDITSCMQYHYARDSIFTIVAKYLENPVDLGLIKTDFNNVITEFVEKPAVPYPALANTGIYIINRGILRLIPDGFYDFGKQLLPRLIGHIQAYPCYDYWSDIGSLQSYYSANIAASDKYSASACSR